MMPSVVMIDDHMYRHARNGDVGVLVDSGNGIGNAFVDWGQGAVKCHWSRFDLV